MQASPKKTMSICASFSILSFPYSRRSHIAGAEQIFEADLHPRLDTPSAHLSTTPPQTISSPLAPSLCRSLLAFLQLRLARSAAGIKAGFFSPYPFPGPSSPPTSRLRIRIRIRTSIALPRSHLPHWRRDHGFMPLVNRYIKCNHKILHIHISQDTIYQYMELAYINPSIHPPTIPNYLPPIYTLRRTFTLSFTLSTAFHYRAYHKNHSQNQAAPSRHSLATRPRRVMHALLSYRDLEILFHFIPIACAAIRCRGSGGGDMALLLYCLDRG